VKAHKIVWRPKARDDLLALYDWIAGQAEPETAFAYTAAIEAHAAKLSHFPNRGSPIENFGGEDLGEGIRTISYRRRAVIACRVVDDAVEIVRLVHGGQLLDGVFEG
jgi:toxin ParE1/3/4